MKSFVLTGGIGAGKSSVLKYFEQSGAESIDADKTVSSLQQPGEVVFEQIRKRFGDRVLTSSGNLDRQALAETVFADPLELADLEAIVHPAVKRSIEDQLAKLRAAATESERVVIIDIPLVENRRNLYGAEGLIVVDCPIDVVLERLVSERGLSPEDALARIENQISRSKRLELADFVIDNAGSYTLLEAEVQQCWEWVLTR